MAKLLIGTSGWSYTHWRGVFYPEGLSSSLWLEHYAKFFNAVELNVTFYRLVRKKTFKVWAENTPKNFYFVAKGSRFITHVKRLNSVKRPLGLLIDNLIGLDSKLAAILWQLPPSFKKNLFFLERFLKLLEKTRVRQIFEFRHKDWFDGQVLDLLRKYRACLCIAHSERFPCVKEITSDFIYLRFHGNSVLYGSNYIDRELKQWSQFVSKFKRNDVFAFFNNDACGYAVQNALAFKELLKKY